MQGRCREEWRLQCRTLHAVGVSRGGRSAKNGARVSRRGRRPELGRHRVRSEIGLSLRRDPGRWRAGMDREEPDWRTRTVRQGHTGSHRTGARQLRCPDCWLELALPEAAVGPAHRRQCVDRRLFVAATDDNRFRAFEAKSGKELWVTKLERRGNADPITYQGKNGKQYVAVVATDTVMVYAVP